MTKNWKDIHPNFTLSLQYQWEIDNNFTYHQTKEWIDIGLTPHDADFCGWLQAEGYTALAVLNNADAHQLRTEYQASLISQSLFDWYSDGKLTVNQFSLLSHKLGIKVVNNINLTQLTNLLTAHTIPAKPNYPLTKILLVIALTGTVIYLLTN